ncbi:hypothetical protein AB0J43_11885 [Nonomuraea fuscirosea]
MSALANDLRRYVTEHGNVTGRIAAGTVTFTVVADRRRADEALALWRSLTADRRLLTGDLRDAPAKGVVRWRIELTTTDAAATLIPGRPGETGSDAVAGGELDR